MESEEMTAALHRAADALVTETPELAALVEAVETFLSEAHFADEDGVGLAQNKGSLGYGLTVGWLAGRAVGRSDDGATEAP